MRNLLIKFNIFALLGILPLQSFAAASMLHCQKMNAGKAAVSQMSSMHKMKQDKSQAAQPVKMTEHCQGMQMNADKNTGDASNTICPHCYTCGIYTPALLTSFEPLPAQFDSSTLYRDIESRFTSFIPPSPLHPPSLL
jgi:hypothetical protein